MWDPFQRAPARALAAAVLTFLCLAAISCSDETGTSGGGRDTTGHSQDRKQSTPPGEETTGSETTAEASLSEATLGPAPDAPAVLLRLEGDPGTTFSGICAVGGKESILSGKIPKRYAFDPRGQRLTCRIEKQDAGGALKVIVIAGDATRSVQQTNTRGSVIKVSYKVGRT